MKKKLNGLLASYGMDEKDILVMYEKELSEVTFLRLVR